MQKKISDHLTQSSQIARYLEAGKSLNGTEALHLFRCHDLPKRISELRWDGVRITGTWEVDAKGTRTMRYALAPPAPSVQRVRILSVHPCDGHYARRAEIVGKLAEVTESRFSECQPTKPGYGTLTCRFIDSDFGSTFFYAVQYEVVKA